MSHTIHGQRVVVLGGSSGIGYAIAQQSLAQGALVTITGRDESRLDTARKQLSNVSTARFDVNDLNALTDFLDAIDGPIGHIFIGAGAPLYSRLDQLDVADARSAVADSVSLTLCLAKNAAPIMSPGGTMTFMGGTSARIPAPGMSVINATMGSSSALVKALALEIAPVRINQIAAGFVDTPLSARLLGDALDQRRADLRKHLPIRRVVTADDVAALALHLMVNTAVTGAVFDIDGGQQLLPPVGA